MRNLCPNQESVNKKHGSNPGPRKNIGTRSKRVAEKKTTDTSNLKISDRESSFTPPYRSEGEH
jgi:hypothetical protein